MALITCPECGAQISDKTQACMHCGAPIRINKKVKIKIPRFVTGMLSQNAAQAKAYVRGQCLWEGFSGQVASFEASGTSAVVIKIIKAYTGHPFPFFKDFEIDGIVNPGVNYEIKNARTSLAFGDPSKSTYVFSEVDVIDSGI